MSIRAGLKIPILPRSYSQAPADIGMGNGPHEYEVCCLTREPYPAEYSDLFETFREASKYLGLILGYLKIGKKC